MKENIPFKTSKKSLGESFIPLLMRKENSIDITFSEVVTGEP